MAWKGVVTNAGRALLDSYALGGHTLTLLGATVGSGTVQEANLRTQTAVTNEKDDASIISAKAIAGGSKYKIQIGPASASVGAYTAHQIGLWAKLDNGSATLLLLAQDADTGVSVPLASVSPNFAFAVFAALAVDNTDDLSVSIDETTYVTVGTMNETVETLTCLVIDCGTVSSLPKTVTDARITEDMVVINSVLGTPSAQAGDWTVTTSDGSLQVAGTISGSTTLTLYLMKKRT